jgi:hypothetical protein
LEKLSNVVSLQNRALSQLWNQIFSLRICCKTHKNLLWRVNKISNKICTIQWFDCLNIKWICKCMIIYDVRNDDRRRTRNSGRTKKKNKQIRKKKWQWKRQSTDVMITEFIILIIDIQNEQLWLYLMWRCKVLCTNVHKLFHFCSALHRSNYNLIIE